MSAADAPREIPAREIVARAKAAGEHGCRLASPQERDAARVAAALGCVTLHTDPATGALVRARFAPGGEEFLAEHEARPLSGERIRARVAAQRAERAAAPAEEELRYALHLAAAADTMDARDGVSAALMPSAFRALQGTGLVEHFRSRAPFEHTVTIRVRITDAGRAYLAHLRAAAQARRDAFLRECIDVEEVATDVLLTAVRRFAVRSYLTQPGPIGDAAEVSGGVVLSQRHGAHVAEAYVYDGADEARRYLASCDGKSDREALRDLARQLYDHTPAAEGSATPHADTAESIEALREELDRWRAALRGAARHSYVTHPAGDDDPEGLATNLTDVMAQQHDANVAAEDVARAAWAGLGLDADDAPAGDLDTIADAVEAAVRAAVAGRTVPAPDGSAAQ